MLFLFPDYKIKNKTVNKVIESIPGVALQRRRISSHLSRHFCVQLNSNVALQLHSMDQQTYLRIYEMICVNPVCTGMIIPVYLFYAPNLWVLVGVMQFTVG